MYIFSEFQGGEQYPEKVCVVSAILPRPPPNRELMNKIKSDIEIARSANIKPIDEVLAKAKVPDDPFAFSPMGRHIAKINLEYISTLKERKSNLILVSCNNSNSCWRGKNHNFCRSYGWTK